MIDRFFCLLSVQGMWCHYDLVGHERGIPLQVNISVFDMILVISINVFLWKLDPLSLSNSYISSMRSIFFSRASTSCSCVPTSFMYVILLTLHQYLIVKSLGQLPPRPHVEPTRVQIHTLFFKNPSNLCELHPYLIYTHFELISPLDY